jgi:hypothetical protein
MVTYAIPGNSYIARLKIENGLSINLMDVNTCSDYISEVRRERRIKKELDDKCLEILKNLPSILIKEHKTTFKKLEKIINGADNVSLLKLLTKYDNVKCSYEFFINNVLNL